MPFHVFLSHSSADKPAVEELARRLAREGIQAWLDRWHLIPGDPWQPAIEKALAESETCAVFVGPGGFSPWQNEEMRAAIDHRVRETARRFRVIPVLLPAGKRAERSSLPAFLATTTWVEFRDSLEEPEAFHLLVCGIRGVEPGPGPGQAIYEGQCPYRGLRAFDVDDAPFFFGREALVQWLLNGVRPAQEDQPVNRFLAIVGASGSGKSSVARAGLVAALKRDAIPGSSRWPTAILRPGPDPVESLAVAVSRALNVTQNATALAELIEAFRTNEKTLHLMARQSLPENSPSMRLVILVDQFEEVFTHCLKEDLREALIRNLLYAAKVAQGQTLVILTMRADFYPKCATNAELAAAFSDHHLLVGPMTDDELRRAIEKPVQSVGCKLEAGLVDLLLRDVHHQPGALPLLQYALLELWNKRDSSLLSVKVYQEIGRLEGALERRADATLEALSKQEQELCRRTFLRLTQPGEGTEDTKRRVSMQELLSMSPVRSAEEAIIQKLTAAALLTTEGDLTDREAFVEVAHEALIRSWPQLRHWIDVDRAGFRTRTRLTEAVREWKKADRDATYLYSGARLAVAEEWAGSHPDELSIDEAEFLRGSREAQNRREATELQAARTLAEALKERAEEAEKREQEEKVSGELRTRLAREERERQEHEIEAAQNLAEEQKRRAELSEQREKEQKEAALKLRRRALAAVLAAGVALILLALSVFEVYREKKAARDAELAEIAANDARDRADDLISAMLFRLRRKLELIGRLDLLNEVAEAASEYVDKIPTKLMTDSRLRMRGVTLAIKGDVRRAQGRLPEALVAYQQSLAIAQHLAAQDPSNDGWQQDLATSYVRTGEAYFAQGKPSEALATYQQGLAVAQHLAAKDSSNDGRQQDVAMSYVRIGEASIAQSKPSEALAAYQECLVIAQRLLAKEPSKPDWQGILAAQYNGVGDVQRSQGKFPEALASYQQGLDIRKKLTDQHPFNVDWQRDLSISYDRVGDLRRVQGQFPEALAAYQQSLAIARRLADQDPTNVDWQRDLSLSYGRTGETFNAQGQLPEALAADQQSLAIAKGLADQDPTNVSSQRDLSVAYAKVADVLLAQGKPSEARDSYQQALVIAQRLLAQEPSNTDRQRDLIGVYYHMGICVAQMPNGDSLDQANSFLHTGLDLARLHQQQDLINAFNKALKLLNH